MSLVPVDMVMDLPMIVGNHTSDEVRAALDWASDAVESYCERSFAQVLADTVTVDPYYGSLTNRGGYGSDSSYSYGGYPVFGSAGFSGVASYGGRAMLPNPPVTDVAAVQAWLPQATGTDMAWTDLEFYAWTQDGLLYDTSMLPGNLNGPQPSWPTLPASLKVTYDHGFILPDDPNANLPDGIVSSVIKGAASYLANPQGFTNLHVGDVSFAFNPFSKSNTSAGILDEVLLGRYRLVSL